MVTSRITGPILALVVAFSVAHASQAAESLTPRERLALAEAVAPSLARVEWTLRYDQGDSPQSSGWRTRCPNCGRLHGSIDGATLVEEQRPLETAGFVLSDRRIVAPDPMIPSRFVKAVTVRTATEVTEARVVAYARHHRAVFLESHAPLENADPLNFQADAPGPHVVVTYERLDGIWTINSLPLSKTISIKEDGRKFLSVASNCVIISTTGVPVGLCLREYISLDDSWRGSPDNWPTVPAEQLDEEIQRVKQVVTHSVLRVRLDLRSPRRSASDSSWYWRGNGENETGRWAQGVLFDERLVLVLTGLKPSETARLERILVYPADAEPLEAVFRHTLRDYNALIVELSRPLDGVVPLDDSDILEHSESLLLAADVELRGEQQVFHYRHTRLAGYELGWKGKRYPQLADYPANCYLFRRDGALLAQPIARRHRVLRGEYGYGDNSELTPVGHLLPMLREPAKHADAHNVPLPESQEGRLAWMGVELQPLDEELARANQVAHLAEDGERGALVTYVYEGSPAAQAEVEPGYVLMWLEVEDHPEPFKVRVESDRRYEDSDPWRYADHMLGQDAPPLWPSANNTLSRGLTELGFGARYAAAFFKDGRLIRKELEVVESPPHYGSAPRFKSDVLGLTVRNLTYEVRRHFQRGPGEPGVIVSRVEPGGKAAVAGLRPYEIITYVNDNPVTDVTAFEEAIANKTELRLAVKRMTQGRLVRLSQLGAASTDQEQPPSRLTD